ncbi:PREDICTED: uncharacterized protein LOC104816486 [Tarenaya hassleriana]|uniref:uncharacterized protein LOC104816486 n=1 Tax=Tarenaya hassleriana TaxID=28532 RepID=UPI00053C6BA8|nr:PREDICTED: uncharacterized protein LOC104816486 [Tarenaya hassleriana]
MEKEKRDALKALIVLVLISGFTLDYVAGESYCRAQRRVLVNACKRLLLRLTPNAECCDRLRKTPTRCVCPIVTPQMAALIDVNYVVGVIRSCGRRVPHGFKCGSLTAP